MEAQDIRIRRRVHRLKTVDGIRLLNNHVLLKRLSDNMNTPTEGGLYRASPFYNKNQFLANYTDRIFEVVTVPDHLVFYTNNNKVAGHSMRWKCDMELEVGDIVCVSYPSVLDFEAFLVDKAEYWCINYKEIRLARKADGSKVLLNGWVLYRHADKEKYETELEIPDTLDNTDWTRGVVFMTGKPNKEYCYQDKWYDYDGGADIKEGDVFIKADPQHKLILEDPLFRYFYDEDLYLIQRKDIVALV